MTARTTTLTDFVGWLYTGRLPHKYSRFNDIGKLVPLYILADQVEILSLRRALIDETKKHLTTSSGEAWVEMYFGIALMYNNLPRSSPLIQLHLKRYIHHWHPSYDEEETDESIAAVPGEFFYAVMAGQADASFSNEHLQCPCCNDLCAFHEHKSDEEREASKSTLVHTLATNF